MIRTIWAVLLTMFLMHAVTVYFLVFHKDKFCEHSSKMIEMVKSVSNGSVGSPRLTASANVQFSQAKVVTTPKEFSEVFGTITGVEASDAADESYSTLLK